MCRKKKTLRQRHRETCLTGVLGLPAVLCFRAPELTWEFRGCTYGTMMEHVAPPQVPPPCSSPTFSLPHVAGAGTCLPAFFPDKKHCCCGHRITLASESLYLLSLGPEVIQRYLSIEFIQLPVLRSCAPQNHSNKKETKQNKTKP